MNNTVDHDSKNVQESVFEKLEIYVSIVCRRKWLIILPTLLSFIVGLFLAFTIPPTYRSSTLILIEPQQVPDDIVSQSDTTPIQSRLKTLRSQIMSRTSLEKIVKEFLLSDKNLEQSQRGLVFKVKEKTRKIFSAILKKLKLDDFISLEPSEILLEEKVERLRKNISVKVVSSGKKSSATFEVSTIGKDPYTTMQITNSISSLYIEENLKNREQFAIGISEFLGDELEAIKRNLEDQEKAVKAFRMKNMGALPDQLDANLRTLDRLQSKNENLLNSLTIFEGEKARLDGEVKSKEAYLKGETTFDGGQTVPGELVALRAELTLKLAVYKENYPDVILLKIQIKNLEMQMEESGKRKGTKEKKGINSGLKKKGFNVQFKNSEIASLKNRVSEVKYKISSIKHQITKTKKQVVIYGNRVEATPSNEQGLTELLRNYNISNRNYESLLTKQLNARLAENMEKRQKGEKFRVIDPANFPLSPFKPNRLLIIFIAIAIGISFGSGLIYLVEFISPPFRNAVEFKLALGIPVLATIPIFDRFGNGKKKKSKQLQKGFCVDLDLMVLEQYYIFCSKYGLLDEKKSVRTLAVTSSVKGEGKTLNSIMIGYVLAQQFNKKVIVVECDLKRPSMRGYFPDIHTKGGLVDLLKGTKDSFDVIKPFSGISLSLLPAPIPVPNSMKLLHSNALVKLLKDLKSEYEYIILDCPPILYLADMNILYPKVDDVVIVTRAGSTPKDIVQKAVSTLGHSNVSGSILNGIDVILRKNYYHYYK